MKTLSPTVTWRDIETITPYRLNNKTHPESQVKRIAASISKYGFDVPIVLDGSGEIIKGEGRYLASRLLKMDKVPVIVRTDMTPEEVRAARIADNRSALSEFDNDALSIELPSLLDEGFSLDDLGFTKVEFDDLMALTVPGSLDDIDAAGEPEKPSQSDETADWPKIHMKVPPEIHDVFLDLLDRAPSGKPHERLEAVLSAVDVLALERLASGKEDR